jgi:hypothetical protein
MNTQLTNEQIARVFAMYLPSKALWKDPDGDMVDIKLNGVTKDVWKSTWLGKTMWNGIEFLVPVENFKLLLTPLSAISDEDAIEVVKLCGMPKNAEVLKVVVGGRGNFVEVEYKWKNKVAELNLEDGYSYSAIAAGLKYDNKWQVREYLIQKGYAVPLFIEPNHPLNGKTAIEIGLAIDSTTTKNLQP